MIIKNQKGFTLTEVLVAMVISMISIAAIFFSYQNFSKAYDSVSNKAEMNSNARDALSQIAREVRNTGRVDPNTVMTHNPIRDTNYLVKFTSPRGYGQYVSGADFLQIFYDDSPTDRIRVDYGIKKYKDSNDTYLARTYMVFNCTAPNNCTLPIRNVDQVFINNVEDFQVILKDKDGNELTEVNNLAGNPGKEKQSKVKTIEIYLTVKSNNKIYKSNKTWEIKNADRSYTKVDQYHRDTYFVSVYPRNLVKN